jgi:hypothetical protein
MYGIMLCTVTTDNNFLSHFDVLLSDRVGAQNKIVRRQLS